jgi:hypothetical protein
MHNRSARLARLIELDAPAIAIHSEMRMLLEAFEAYELKVPRCAEEIDGQETGDSRGTDKRPRGSLGRVDAPEDAS